MSWDRDPVLTLNEMADELTSPKERSARLASFAKEAIEEAADTNRQATGRDVPYETTVDRQPGKPIDSVDPEGVVFVEFELMGGVLEWIGDELLQASPILTGKYMRSHMLFVDGVEHEPSAPMNEGAAEYAFVNQQPYSRKIERGLSPQVPDGVYAVIAALAARRFGNLASITFSFRSVSGPKRRLPASAPMRPRRILRTPAAPWSLPR